MESSTYNSSSSKFDKMLARWFMLLTVCTTTELCVLSVSADTITLSSTEKVIYESFDKKCERDVNNFGAVSSANCLSERCGMRVVDGVFSESDINKLHSIVEKGMAQRESFGGPTILDINTGFIRDTKGLDNLFYHENDIYTAEDFEHYGRIIATLKTQVAQTFDVSDLHFTAPTFITRLDGTKEWQPSGPHDEYWHAHADMNNTAHYHYSGLLYMSTFGEDFTGGRMKMLKKDSPNVLELGLEIEAEEDELVDVIVEPRAGRLIIFTAGPENPHRVEKVQSGQRFVLSFWFTCNPQKEFEIFLDGGAHTVFSHKMRDTNTARLEQHRQKKEKHEEQQRKEMSQQQRVQQQSEQPRKQEQMKEL